MWPFAFNSRRPASSRPCPHRAFSYRPRVEALEDRCLLSSAGALDTTFAGTGVVTTSLSSKGGPAEAVMFQPNGKIVDAGAAENTHGTFMALVRYNANGALDS